MINRTESDEKLHLEKVKLELHHALTDYELRLREGDQAIRDGKDYLGAHRRTMDGAEKASARESVNLAVASAEVILETVRRIRKLISSPYFGRFDFTANGRSDALPVYIGIHNFVSKDGRENLIYDWRAPISTLFYDYELGRVSYDAPSGTISGEVKLKRQFRIREGGMEFMIESGLNVQDDVLQEELSRSSDDRMKNIVATIQREQNAIIRNEQARVMVIQGVAGSGKTSIALHRIAFLLYRFKESLTSRDVLIISPNKVFADYISNVLPELGEEQIAETEMEDLANEILGGKVRFQTFFEQSSTLVETDDAGLAERVGAKSTPEFLGKLDKYVAHLEKSRFSPADLEVDRYPVSAEFIAKAYDRCRGRPYAEALANVALAVERHIRRHHHADISSQARRALKTALGGMYRKSALLKTYRDFYAWLGKPRLFKHAKPSELEYSDVFPLIHLKLRLEGIKDFHLKPEHLLIDEMQDYTAVQYAVIKKLFPCNKTILGDANQSVSPLSASTSETIRRVFEDAFGVRLCKSYRSTYEITKFAQGVKPDADLVAIERHGEDPKVLGFPAAIEEIEHIGGLVESARERGHRTTGIICKTQRAAERLFKDLDGKARGLHLLNARSSAFRQGVVICTAHLAKGLEFDQVIVPHATARNYSTPTDRNLLYVACTRAMHSLCVTFAGEITPLLSAGASA